ncbi:hypothetical protein CPB86DRAFT_820370 [Serendipita vermifera]|nr:hypothetical protein CPB86DRAFT_820370 [Serendipita vermifera]
MSNSLSKPQRRKVTSSTASKDAATTRGQSDSPTFPNADKDYNIQRSDTKGLEGDERQPHYKSCHENAQVLGLYLKEANLEGQELTTLWNNGLDSLLIFPDPSSLHVNALWYCSFTLTLIIALSGVLAKGWIAYYNPVSRGEHASEASQHHLRATRSQRDL